MRVLCLVSIALTFGCGGIRVGDVGPPFGGGLEIVPVPGLQTITIAPRADAVVNSDPSWAGKELGEEEWLMAGGVPARGVYWLTYLEFDISHLEPDAVYSAVTFRMPWLDGDPVPLDAHLVRGEWDEETITWNDQPSVSATPVVGLSRGLPACDGDCADLTYLFNEAIDDGEPVLSLVIVPSRPWEGGSVRWKSMESIPEDSWSGDVPTIRFVVGDPPPPPSAAQTDRLRGLD